MPTQREVKKLAKKRGVGTDEMSRMVFGRMRSLGWRSKSSGGPLKSWTKRKVSK